MQISAQESFILLPPATSLVLPLCAARAAGAQQHKAPYFSNTEKKFWAFHTFWGGRSFMLPWLG